MVIIILVIMLLLSGCQRIEVIESDKCLDVVVNVKGEINNEGEFVLACDATFKDLSLLLDYTSKADTSIYHDNMPIYDGDVLEIPAYKEVRISINYGSVEELCQVNGIGLKTAEAIVSYREEHGLFLSLDDLINVKGIGEKKLAKFKEYLKL